MKLQNETIIMPLPDDSLIEYFEDSYGPFVLPEDYKMFLKKYNGVVPETRVFDFHVLRICGRTVFMFIRTSN